MYFWAKTTSDGNPGISVYEHMINVGCVAQSLVEIWPKLLAQFNLLSGEVGMLAALHDLGKISPGFQQKCVVWLEENSLLEVAKHWCWDTSMELDHGKVSHAAIQSFLLQKGYPRKTAKYFSSALGAHHGRLSPPSDRGYHPEKAISASDGSIDWDAERLGNAQKVWAHFSGCRSSIHLDEDSPILWWLAGLTTVADWIGSNETFFPTEQGCESKDVSSMAWHALKSIGFNKTEFVSDLSFHDLFHDKEHPEIEWSANEIQQKAHAEITSPGVYVIEAPMGMGKTEAALWAAYKLLVSEKATGIYFALPTQATSNRIHLRLNEFLSRITKEGDSSRLIHGNSWLKDDVVPISPASTDPSSKLSDDARIGRDWFASTKRALLAPFGVGTVDQALLGVVAAKHFFVRHFALAGKVVILDEIHSYDLYTGTLIDKLITTLEGLGCTVIVLSATLTAKRLAEIVSLHEELDSEALPYPLITGRKEEQVITPIEVTEPKSCKVAVEFASAEEAINEAIAVVKKGGAVLWICNTVDAAQRQYRVFMEREGADFPIGLLHSRFPHWRREEIESEWMERLGKNSGLARDSILISTQIVEQSVDLDADLMITELAPTDMLLQRLGRLWRHKRSNRPVEKPKLCIINEAKSLEEYKQMEAEAIEKSLGSKAKVYAPYVLLRSLEAWCGMEEVSIPSQIRSLLESTYVEQDIKPPSWEELENEWLGTDSAKRMMAIRSSSLWQIALEDQEGVQTRINEIETVALVLCDELQQEQAVFVDGSSLPFKNDVFSLSVAQAIHRNLVKVPEYCFAKIEPSSIVSSYVNGAQSIGMISEKGEVNVMGLKSDYRLHYSNDLGLEIQKS